MYGITVFAIHCGKEQISVKNALCKVYFIWISKNNEFQII